MLYFVLFTYLMFWQEWPTAEIRTSLMDLWVADSRRPASLSIILGVTGRRTLRPPSTKTYRLYFHNKNTNIGGANQYYLVQWKNDYNKLQPSQKYIKRYTNSKQSNTDLQIDRPKSISSQTKKLGMIYILHVFSFPKVKLTESIWV